MLAVGFIAAGLLAALMAPTAQAAPTSVIYAAYGGLLVRAAPGMENHVLTSYQHIGEGHYADVISDTVGMDVGTAEQRCIQTNAKTATCPDTSTGTGDGPSVGEDPHFYLGTGNDTFSANTPDSTSEAHVWGGSGADKLTGHSRPAVVPGFEDEPGDVFTSRTSSSARPAMTCSTAWAALTLSAAIRAETRSLAAAARTPCWVAAPTTG